MLINKVRSSCRMLSALVVLFVGLSSQQALAHAHLKVETPAADTTVNAAPEALTLNFSEGIELGFSGVKVTGPDNHAVKTGALKLDPVNNTQLILPLENALSAGKYNVSWHVVSVDGHKTKGNYSFTVK
ncbi:CopC domain-containing protein YobA [Yersinia nurmii]|uniref:Copper resistance protein C n=1 Tax=Yersinia nurmii TaxID=685706 RepID=A0AAW7K7F5_9GAMM|nr:CopC domain-containing protein YobA [Yersinia nurmii]MDN0088769.1 CopC domain-containing protein YobA [Yersinia nurmii]CNE96793.1 putative copper resistance protein [Yersinia nurmii]